MLKIIKGAKIYSPEFLGKKDLLIIGDKIGAIEDSIDTSFVEPYKIEIINGIDKIIFPGFIDSHVHIMGGGGEGGFKTRTPEIMLSQLIKAGITTVVGCLGTDGVTRNMYSLLAKAKSLEEEGLTTYIYTGSYRIPVTTLTGEVIKDLIAIDKIIGVGEIALSDHRSSQPSMDELKKIVSDARVGGMLSGKAGIINVHLGDGESRLNDLWEIVNNTEIPITQFLPTHVTRNSELLAESIKFAKAGGYIDMTTSGNNGNGHIKDYDTSVRPGVALKDALSQGVSENNITFSSDGQGSLPVFDSEGKFIELNIADTSTLFEEVKYAILKQGVSMEKAIKAITLNPARVLKLINKGRIQVGYDADICMVDESDLNLDTVFCKGKIAMYQKKLLMKGTFEV